MTLGTILCKFCCTNLFSKEPKNLDIEESNAIERKYKMWYLAQMAKGNIITEKEKETQSLPLLLILNWKAIEGSATYFREYLRDYMKNGLMKTEARRI
jgi:penicillin-binding protein 1A